MPFQILFLFVLLGGVSIALPAKGKHEDVTWSQLKPMSQETDDISSLMKRHANGTTPGTQASEVPSERQSNGTTPDTQANEGPSESNGSDLNAPFSPIQASARCGGGFGGFGGFYPGFGGGFFPGFGGGFFPNTGFINPAFFPVINGTGRSPAFGVNTAFGLNLGFPGFGFNAGLPVVGINGALPTPGVATPVQG